MTLSRETVSNSIPAALTESMTAPGACHSPAGMEFVIAVIVSVRASQLAGIECVMISREDVIERPGDYDTPPMTGELPLHILGMGTPGHKFSFLVETFLSTIFARPFAQSICPTRQHFFGHWKRLFQWPGNFVASSDRYSGRPVT